MKSRFFTIIVNTIKRDAGLFFFGYGNLLMTLFLAVVTLPIHSKAQPLAIGMDKFLGGATSHELSRYFERYWNQVTPGNAGKWGSVEFSRGTYYWNDLDKIYNFAVKRNILFKHHTLIWGQQQPGWISSLCTADQRKAVEDWIKAVGGRYPAMAMVDVVNEPFHAPPAYKDALGGDGTTGWDWVITAFELARTYCAPGVKLILNEYNVLHSNSVTTNYINLITLLKDRGLIDAIGVQGHYFEFRSDMDATGNIYVHNINTIRSNLDRLAELGLPIYISEFDIDEPDDANQLQQYKIYFPILWYQPAIKGITFWGYIQDDVWHSHPDTYLLLSNGCERPAMQWMKTFIHRPFPPVLISPDEIGGVPINPILLWHASTTADSYHVQVATNCLFTSTVVDTIVTDTLVCPGYLDANRRFFWRVSAINEHGESDFSAWTSFMTGDQVSAVEEQEKTLIGFRLLQNFPNPFNPITTIPFEIPCGSNVRLALLNILGEEVMVITERFYPAGMHSLQLDASRFSSGVYICKLQAGHYVGYTKLVLAQ
ncbi:endo-1,4-beta-xylanase [candidate division KSB1 bacterium]|nr:endo-1,4-beta-xylanase [candidate division KSB1 bacterium]